MEATDPKRGSGKPTYEQDMEDLARFRTAMAKLGAAQKRKVIQQMLGTPDTP